MVRVLSFLSVISAFGFAQPAWMDRPPSEDPQYKYYVGRSSADNEAAAFKSATENATEQAVRENFPMEVAVEDDTYEVSDLKTSKTSTVKRSTQRISPVQLEGFEQADAFVEKDRFGQVHVWTLFRIKKTSLARAQILQKTAKEVAPPYTQIGSDKDIEKGALSVQTIPPGASVWVDGTAFGKTPVRILGQIEPGEHSLILDHPECERVDEKFRLSAGDMRTIQKNLIPATGTLRVTSDPAGAEVRLNGSRLTQTPHEALKVPAGRRLVLEFIHPEADRLLQETEVARDAIREISVKLPLRPGLVSIQTEPPGAQVFIIRGSEHIRHLEAPTGQVSLDPGRYTLEISHVGFETIQKELTVKGGQPVEPLLVRLTGGSGGLPAVASVTPPQPIENDLVSVARRWRQFVYRGFPDQEAPKECVELNKRALVQLKKKKTGPAFRQLVTIAEGEISSDSPMVGEGRRLVDQLMEAEQECLARNSMNRIPASH